MKDNVRVSMNRIALIGDNSVGYIDKLLEIWNSGACAVLLDWRIPCQTLVTMMNEADVHQCYIDEEIYEALNSMYIANCGIIIELFNKIQTGTAVLPQWVYDKYIENYTTKEAVIIYSSGTTGGSKGIALSHYAINSNADSIIDYMNLTLDDCIYITKSMSHASTISGELLVALKTKSKLVISTTLALPRYTLRNISLYNVTTMCINPKLLSMYVDEQNRAIYDLSSLKTIYVSGDILTDKLYDKSHTAFSNIAIYNVYGLSEAGPRVTAQRSCCCKSNSVGKPIKGVKIMLVDQYGNPSKIGEYGIIHVNTPCLFNYYVVGDRKHSSLYNNWFNTGDVGYIDSFGELHILNRVDDMITINAHKIYPRDLEKAIVNCGKVDECVIIKILYRNSEHIGCLYVGKNDINNNIQELLKERFMAHEIPHIFMKCDELPRNINGKISYKLAQEYMQNHLI